jgi:ferric iron reductase protein FhuF
MTGSLELALTPLTELVGHLRWRVGAPGADDLCTNDLVTEPDRLVEVIAATASARGSDDPQVLGSLWWQAYSYRMAGMTLGAWIMSGSAPDPSAIGAGIGMARGRPSSLLVDPTASVIADLGELIDRLFAENLDLVAEPLRARHSLGAQLVWGNTAAGIASVFGALASAEGAPPLRPRIEKVTAALPHRIGELGGWATDSWSFQRKTCCLWWKTTAANGALCEDCSLRPAASGASS